MKYKLIVFLLLMVFAVAGCGTTAAVQQSEIQKPDKIRLAYSTSLTSELIIVAKQMGWFEEEFKNDNIAIEYNKFISGPPIIEAFNGGRLDIGQAGDQPSIQARANNINIKVVGIYCKGIFTPEAKYTSVVVPTGSDIKGIPDLKGKKVGVSVGTNYHKVLFYFLQYHGLTTKDITLVNLDNVNIKTALATNNIDAGVLGEPYVATMEYEKIGHKIEDGTDIKPVYNAIIASDDFAKKYPTVVQRVLKVYDKAIKWVAENPQQAQELIAKDSGVKLEIAEQAVRSNQYDLRITSDVVQSFQETEKFLKDNHVIKRNVDINELIDTSYLKAIGI